MIFESFVEFIGHLFILSSSLFIWRLVWSFLVLLHFSTLLQLSCHPTDLHMLFSLFCPLFLDRSHFLTLFKWLLPQPRIKLHIGRVSVTQRRKFWLPIAKLLTMVWLNSVLV